MARACTRPWAEGGSKVAVRRRNRELARGPRVAKSASMRRFRRPDRLVIRLGNVLPDVQGEIDTRRRDRDPVRDTDQQQVVTGTSLSA
jgi:hypothetical protein